MIRHISQVLGKILCQRWISQKKLGYYEIGHIDNTCEVTIAINPRKYLEKFQSENFNKKHKGIKKGLKGMELENMQKE